MGRRSTLDDKPSVVHEGVAENGINESLLKGYVAEIEDELAKIDEIMDKATADCQPHVDQIKAIKKEAAEHGIPKKPLAAKIRERGLKRKADKCRDGLSAEQQEIFDEISIKLGDLPLFQAAGVE